jgi:hypothetical protein
MTGCRNPPRDFGLFFQENLFMPGYSGTPLPKKLGIKANFRVHFVNLPTDVRDELREALAECTTPKPPSALDFSMLFSQSRGELAKEFGRIAKLLAPAGMLWVSWPKKSSGVATELTEDVVRGVGLDAGLVDVKVCAVTDIWSGLKFVRRVKDRKTITHETHLPTRKNPR